MSAMYRTPLAVVLLVALCGAWNAASSDQGTLQQRKMDALQGALPLAGDTASTRLMEEAAARANALSFVQIDTTGSNPAITFGLSSAPLYTIRVDRQHAQLVIDFVDTILLPDLKTLRIDGGDSTLYVRSELVAVHPRFVTRAFIELDTALRYEIAAEANALTVTLDPQGSADEPSVSQGTGLAQLAMGAMRESELRANTLLSDRQRLLTEKLSTSARYIAGAKVVMIQADLADMTPTRNGLKAVSGMNALRKEMDARGGTLRQIERNYRKIQADREAAHAEARARIQANRSDADSIGAAMARFAQAEQTFAIGLQSLQGEIDRQVAANAMFALRVDRHYAANHPSAHQVGANFDRLDQAFAALREVSGPIITVDDRLAAFDLAMESVSAATPNLSLQSETTLAVLTNQAPAKFSAPPMRRMRTAPRNLDLNAIENPRTMAVLRSSNDALRRAEANGVIVLAQQQTGQTPPSTNVISDAQGQPATPVQVTEPTSGPRRFRVPKTSNVRPEFNLYNENVPADQDPLRQLVNIDFRDMDLTNVVALLAQKGQINVIAGTEVTGTVTANLRNIPLGRAIEIVLRMNGFGILEEAGVYRITSYEEAISAQRETKMIFLKNSQADEIKLTLEDILAGSISGNLVSVSANAATNVVIISGPREIVTELEGVVSELDISEPVVPTITVPIKLNYSEPADLVPIILEIVSDDVGSVTADARSRHLIVTDIPIKVQEIEALIRLIDLPVKQVSIEAMIVDAQLDDDAQTGLQWLAQSTRGEFDTTSSTFETENGVITTESEGNFVSKLGVSTAFLPTSPTSSLFFKVLSGDLDLSAIISAQVKSRNAKLLANPTVVTIENKPAIINITQEFPYNELTQTSEGGSIGSTRFKEIGTILEVTPRVTHDNHIITEINAKESTIVGFSVSDVPIEAKRQAQTTLRMADGQTIFIGGLRSYDERLTVSKTPILGDIPILNFFFTNKRSEQTNTELMIFLTCTVLPDFMPELTPYEKGRFDELGGTSWKVDGTRALVNSYVHPEDQRDPFYKWRRSK